MMNARLDLQHVCDLAARDAAAGATAGRLSPSVVDALRQAGLFKLYLPAELGGLDVGLVEGCRVIAELASADGAAGWAVMINAGPNWFAGCMDPVLAAQVFTPPDSAVAGSGQPGQAEPTPGGWRVAGRWRWCSGAPWATWFTFTAVTPGGDSFAFAVPAGQVRRHDDTWDVRGLRATASWDAELVDVEIPRARSFSLDTPARARDEPIFRVPFMTFASATMAAVSVGLARRALAEFTALARSKRPTNAAGALADDPVVADAIARTTASVRAADAYWNTAVASLWTACDDGEPTESTLETDVLLASSHAVAVGAQAADELWARAGMSVLDVDSTLGRVVADLRAVSQNAAVSAARFAATGAALLKASSQPSV